MKKTLSDKNEPNIQTPNGEREALECISEEYKM